jgi:tetratricopeptide (TPR) repeat protein
MTRSRSRSVSSPANIVLAFAGLMAVVPLSAQLQGAEAIAFVEPPEVDPTAELRLERARALLLLGEFEEARSEFVAAAKLQRASGVLPTEALWGIAEIHHGRAQDAQAAGVLVELAHEAELRGNPVVQAKALLEAIVLYEVLDQHQEAIRLAARLEPLRSSPYLSDELRIEIDTRVFMSRGDGPSRRETA